ncbi:MAG: exo-alpha-sialidase [Marinilabiliaceae bacterium]|nr:exo-alpha-sialidase [Marinilabiliaceae bacterium]
MIGILKINTDGIEDPLTLDKLTVNLNGTKNLDDITGINIYYTGDSEKFSSITQFGAENIQPSAGNIEIDGFQELGYGKNCFFIIFNLKETIKDGSWFDAECVTVTINGEDKTPEISAPEGRKDYLHRVTLVKQGDKGVHTYRIPALVTAVDGTVIAAYDYRWNNSPDLPGNIDVGVSLSHDSGVTWEKSFIAMDLDYGVGDPILTVDKETGRIFLMALYGDGNTGLFSKPITGERPVIAVSHSDDNGTSWSTPRFISTEVNEAGWTTSLAAPGNGMQMRDGTIVIPAYARPVDSSNSLNSFIFYSTDHGETWSSSSLLPTGTTECTVIELKDGRLMLNMRNHHNQDVRAVAHTSDMGTTWSSLTYSSELLDPVCQGNMIRYTSTLDGYQKDRILISNAAASSRTHMTIKMSYDEGET